ncbi:MAG: FecR domain-containing protein [Phormidesmis sp. RL_2_1]|nr:FecR domain-containing protein [Phormidesmis sp. RL_2_1]
MRITNIRGRVEISTVEGGQRQARAGDRLERAGDRVTTGPSSSARIEIDQATGHITMSENTQVQVQTLSITQNGGRVTRLLVTQGQIRTQIRRFTNPDSELEIYTPAGISGVRGTDFGIAVQPNGTTGVATLEGSVATSAQAQTVLVNTNLQTIIFPGEPPIPPETLRDDFTLLIEFLAITTDGESVRLVGRTDAVNLVEVNGESQTLSRDGRFEIFVPRADLAGQPDVLNQRIQVLVITPLGTKQAYELVVP